MNAILTRIDNKFKILAEAAADTSWKDPNSPDYDRQWAEDALYHTIGPLTDTPRWAPKWTSDSPPVPGFEPNGQAPQWAPAELVIAFAGDPNLLFSGDGNPRSPGYGDKGGAPMFRAARKVSRIYNRDKDRSFVADMYGNGMVELSRLMQPGFDKSFRAFIPWAMRSVLSAMEHGIGGEERTSRAAGGESSFGSGERDLVKSQASGGRELDRSVSVRGMASLLDETDPARVRAAAEVVKDPYRNKRSHDKNRDNPFGAFSSEYYQTAMMYADALESKDEEAVERARSRMRQLIDAVEDYSIPIRGASTGMGQAISTPDRSSSVDIVSMHAPGKGNDDTGGMVSSIVGDDNKDSRYDPTAIKHILDIAINYDLGAVLGKSSKYHTMALELGAKKGIGGKMTVNELRYVIRTLGPLGSNYPGRGHVRKNAQIPRDSRGWWEPGDDPEIEPLPLREAAEGAMWHSQWTRNQFKSMGPTEISQEMTAEVQEFLRLGIPTARTVKSKTKAGAAAPRDEAVSKVAVANTVNSARIKLQIIADIHRGQLGLDEGAIKRTGIIAEGMDALDRQIIVETCQAMVRILTRVIASSLLT